MKTGISTNPSWTTGGVQTKSTAVKIIINVATYQVIWFICVLGENSFLPAACALIALHLLFMENRAADLKLMALFLPIGLVVDGALTLSGFFAFNVPAWPIPLWLGVLWLGFALLPHHSLDWMKGKHLLSALFGALGGPLAYWAGVHLGAADFTLPMLPSLAILALVWAILWPLAMKLAAIILPREQPVL